MFQGVLTTRTVLAGLAFASASSGLLAQDVTAVFSDDATEDTTGVFLSVNPVDRGSPDEDDSSTPFDVRKLGMRPIQLSAAGLGKGLVRLDVDVFLGEPDLLELYRPDGTPVILPATFAHDGLPPRLFVNATSTGEALLRLEATAASGGGHDEVLFRVGPFPGLAGQALGTYPFFEFPLAVNENRTLEVALDPVRHAERFGLPYDCYVVEHRTPAEWAANRVLADVTPGIETAVVHGTGIEDNVTAVWAPPLDSDAGILLGKPFDIVFDFGLDGRLDPGDLIDGLSFDEAGIEVMKDTTLLGPRAVDSFEFDDANLFLVEGFDGGSTRTLRSHGLVLYPKNMGPGKLPLVTFSHGNTGINTSFRGYRYLQRLLASHGYITASFDMFPAHVSLGIRWRGWLTNKNTERLIGQTNLVDHLGNPYPPMGNGVIDDKVDPTRIVTSGHSRGGEGVIVQYQQIANPDIPEIRPPNGVIQYLTKDSFCGIHSIAQVTFLTAAQGSRTDDRNYLMYFGSSDNDVCGCSASVLPTIHYNRARGNKAMVYLYGAGHGYFNSQWSCTCAGPDLMDRAEVEAVSAGYLLPWVQMVVRGEDAGRDYFTRAPSVFRPIGTEFIPPVKALVNLYRDANKTGNFVLDDYEAHADDMALSSSGQLVTFKNRAPFEGFFLDTDPSGGYSQAEPDGGFWWETNGSIFNYTGDDFHYTQTIAPEERDLSDDTYVSFITCQQSGHRNTDNLPGGRDFTVTLVDAHGVESSIHIAAYGEVDEPYRRVDNGWGSAFTTYRLRIADFENNGSGIDLKDVVELSFRFGNFWGSEEGRLGFDDIEIVR